MKLLFTGQNPAAAKNCDGILGSFELLRKFYVVVEYSEVAKIFTRVYTHTYAGR